MHNAEPNKPKYLPLVVRHRFSLPGTYLPRTHTELSSHQFYLQPVDGRSYLKRKFNRREFWLQNTQVDTSGNTFCSTINRADCCTSTSARQKTNTRCICYLADFAQTPHRIFITTAHSHTSGQIDGKGTTHTFHRDCRAALVRYRIMFSLLHLLQTQKTAIREEMDVPKGQGINTDANPFISK